MARITLKKHREQLELAEQMIADATDYTEEYLKLGSSCDSSPDASLRMEYVKRAEKKFIENNKHQILKIAAQLIRDEINDACKVYDNKCPDGLLPDGPTCPACGKKRAPSGVDRGMWVHFDG